MGFLNTMMLGGVAAMAAPLLIHLLNRTRYRTLDWGAMHLLEAALHSNARRWHWEAWLMLIVRCMIPLLFAVALARPVLTQFQQSGAQADKSLLLMVDDSLSMSAEKGQQSVFKRAQRELTRILQTAPAVEYGLWTTALPLRNHLSEQIQDPIRVSTTLNQLPSPTGSSSPLETLRTGLETLNKARQPYRQLLLASDFQASQWRSLSDGQLESISQPLKDEDSGIQLTLLKLGPADSTANLATQIIDSPPRTLVDADYQLSAGITNHSANAIDRVVVHLVVDGTPLVSRNIQLAAHASEQMQFICRFEKLGWHSLAIGVDDPYSVPGDDWCHSVVQVSPALRMLVIDDSLNVDQLPNDDFVGTSRYIRLALAPLDSALENQFSIETIGSAVLNSRDLAGIAAIIVADATQGSQTLQDRLREYVQAGGALLCFPPESNSGDNWKTAWNQSVNGEQSWLPMLWGETETLLGDRSISLDSQANVQRLQGTSETTDGQLGSLQFKQWVKLTTPANGRTPQVLLKLANGSPWLVELPVGEGLVVQCASSCGDADSNMTRQPAFVPLMMSLADRLVRHGAGISRIINGQTINLRLQQSHVDRSTTQVPKTSRQASMPTSLPNHIAVKHQDDQVDESNWTRLPVKDRLATVIDTRRPGIYQADVVGQWRTTTNIQPARFAVAIDPSESQLECLDTAELQQLAKKLGATLINSADEFASLSKLQRDGLEFWRWLLAAVLGLLFIELLLGMRASMTSGRGAP